MINELGYIDYTNPLIRNSYGIKQKLVDFLEEHNMKLFVNVDEGTVIVYDNDGNDIEHMTLSQLSKRVQISWLYDKHPIEKIERNETIKRFWTRFSKK